MNQDPYFLKVYVLNSSNPGRNEPVYGMSFVVESESSEFKHEISLPRGKTFTYQQIPAKWTEFTNEEGIRANNAFVIGSRQYFQKQSEPEQSARFKLKWKPYYERQHGRYDPDLDVIKLIYQDDILVASYPEPELTAPGAPPLTRTIKMATLWGKLKQD